MADYSLKKGRNRTEEEKQADAVLFTPTGGSRGRGANPANMSASVREKLKNSTVVNKPVDSVPLRGASPSLKDFVSKPSSSSYKSSSDGGIDKVSNSKKSMLGTGYTPLKDLASKRDEPVVSVEKVTKIVKPTSAPPAKSSRNSMADEWAAFSKGREADTAALKDITDRYKQTGTLVKAEDSDLPKPSELKDTDFKKGGMTKRPPKPAKKVPARKFASGGSVSRTSASKRGDGCATKGHTKGKYC